MTTVDWSECVDPQVEVPVPADGEVWAVGAVIRNERGEAFAQQRSPDRRLFPGCWDIVGGHVEDGEGLLDALAREITEETGWRLRRVERLIGVVTWHGDDGLGLRHEADFLVEVDGDLSRPELEWAKHTAYDWFGPADLPRLKENRAPGELIVHDVLAKVVGAVPGEEAVPREDAAAHGAPVPMSLPLSVRDLTPDDLASCDWAGSALHLESVAAQLERARRGEVDYLAVCPPSGVPVAVGGVDYRVHRGAGVVWQLVVHPALRSCGIGTSLIRAAEQRIRSRGLERAELAVEESNPRARALYERLGYVAYGREPDGWDELAPDGTVRRHETVCIRMRKDLG